MLVIPMMMLVAASTPFGCYTDDRTHRQMQFCPTQSTPNACASQGVVHSVTREWCKEQCGRMGKALAGVEAGHACFCDNGLVSRRWQ